MKKLIEISLYVMVLTFYALSANLIFSSCTHKSELKHESGVVIEKQFSPEFNASSTGFNTDGSLSFSDIQKDEEFLIVFKCEHQTVFTINRKDLYATLEKGDTVDIQFYENLRRDNTIKDFDFVTAIKKGKGSKW